MKRIKTVIFTFLSIFITGVFAQMPTPTIEITGKGGLESSGSLKITGKGVGDLSIVDSVFYFDGTSGIDIEVGGVVYVLEFLFQSDRPIGPDEVGQVLFHSGAFEAYFSNFTSGITNEYIGWKNSYRNIIGGASNNTIDTRWHHLIVYYEHNYYKMYLDGIELNQSVTSYIPALVGVDKLRIGLQTTGNYGFKGKMDNIRIYDRDLPANGLSKLLQDGREHVRRLNSKHIVPDSLKEPEAARFHFENNLQDEMSTLSMEVKNGTERYQTDLSGNSVLELDGETSVFFPYSTTSLGALSFYFRLNESTSSFTSNGAGVLFSASSFIARRDFIAVGDVTTVIDGEAFVIGNNDFGTYPYMLYTKNPLESYEWHHLFLNYNESKGAYDVYLNGELLDVLNNGNTGPFALEGFTLGVMQNSMWTPRYIKAYIDDLTLYQYSQSQEVLSEYFADFAERKTDLDFLVTSLQDRQHDESIYVYPNPVAEGPVTIRGITNPRYKLFNAEGTLIEEGQGNDLLIPSSVKGLIILEVTNDMHRKVFKLIR